MRGAWGGDVGKEELGWGMVSGRERERRRPPFFYHVIMEKRIEYIQYGCDGYVGAMASNTLRTLDSSLVVSVVY